MNQTLKAKRKAAGLTQAQVAKFAGIAERNYRRYESNSACEPIVTTAIRIAKALGTTVEQIWGNTPYVAL